MKKLLKDFMKVLMIMEYGTPQNPWIGNAHVRNEDRRQEELSVYDRMEFKDANPKNKAR